MSAPELLLDVACKELESLASKWEDLGHHLKLSDEKIQELKSKGGTQQDYLSKVLSIWKCTTESEKCEESPSWERLLECVEKLDHELADALNRKFCSIAEASVDGAVSDGGHTDVAEDEVVREKIDMEAKPGKEQSEKRGQAEPVVDAHIFSESWSKLRREEVIDRIKGTIYGQAIGDALGLATEFMNKHEASVYYKKGLSYDAIVPDFHRSRWDQGDWTDDTDQMLLILMMVIENNGKLDQIDFAKRMHGWMCHGFKELGDIGGMGIGFTVKQTLTRPYFCTDPVRAARDVWEVSGKYLAANGAIMRTSILGTLSFNDLSRVTSNTVNIAKVTHADPRCHASCVAVTIAIALMLQGTYNLSHKDQLSAIIAKATAEASKLLEHKDQQKEMKTHINSSLKGLKLDSKNTLGYTFKALGSGFHGFKKETDFRKTIIEVIMEGGDADSNAAVCGALMGCKVGFKNLPEDLLQFKHREWLDKKVDAFLKVTGLLL